MIFSDHVEENELFLENAKVDADQLIRFLQENTHITKLSLDNCNIGNEEVKALANGNLTNLTKLYLRSDHIGDEGAKALANGNLTNLTELDLWYTHISDEGAKALANGNLTNLTKLYLTRSNIGEEGVKALANGNLTNLTKFYCSGDNFGAKEAKALAECGEYCEFIDKFADGSGNNITGFCLHLKELWSQARKESNGNVSKLDEDITKRLFFYIAERNLPKEFIELFLDDFDKYPFLINSRDEQGHTLAYFYTHDPEIQKFLFGRSMIPEERNQRRDERIAQDNQSVHEDFIVERTKFFTKKLIECMEASEKQLKQAVSSYVESIKLFQEYQNDPVRLGLLGLTDNEKRSVMEETLGNNPIPDDKEFIKIVIDTAEHALETKYLRKNALGEYDEGYPIYEMEYEGKAKITIPESIGYIKLLIDNFSIPLEEKKELLVTLIEQNPERVREKLPIIRKELRNSSILDDGQLNKTELHGLLGSIDDNRKIDELFKEISGLDIEKVWREQKEFSLLKHIYMAATGHEGKSVCPHGTWIQIIQSIEVINTEIMEQFDLYVEEKEKRAAQGDVITEENIVPFIENLANRLIQYVKDNPELEEVLKNHLLYLEYINIDDPEKVTFKQQKILAEINKYFSENIKGFLPNYNRNIPKRDEYRIIIDRLLKVAVLQNFAIAGQGMSDEEDNSNSYATISTDEEFQDAAEQELFKLQTREMETQNDISKASMDLFTSGESNHGIIDTITSFSTVKTPALKQESDKNEQDTTQLTGHVIQEDFIQELQPKSLVNIRNNNIQIIDEITQVAKINPDEWTSLHDAAEIGDKERVKALIKIEKDINARDKYGRTPLHYAASKGHTEILRSLLDAGGKFDKKDNVGMTPLCLAIVNDYQEIVETLVEKGANVNVVSKSGKTPLDWLSISRHKSDDLCISNCSHTEIEEILLKNGAVGNNENTTPHDNVQKNNIKADNVQLNTLENKSTSTISSQLQTSLQEYVISSDEYEQDEQEKLSYSNSSEIQLDAKPTPIETPFVANKDYDQVSNTQSNSKQPSDPNKNNPALLQNTKRSKLPVITASTLVVISGIISEIAIAGYLGMLAVGITVGVCCLITAAVIYYCNSPSNLLKNSNTEVAMNQGQNYNSR